MITERVYEVDSLKREHLATVLSCYKVHNTWFCVFDSTIFYPECGGQPCDTGQAGDAFVSEVQIIDNTVFHMLDKQLEVGKQVLQKIDWDRRLDLMQQHSAEHIVSGTAHRLFGVENVGFHLTIQSCLIDLNHELSDADIAILEKETNALVMNDIPVLCYYPEADDLSEISFRSKQERIHGDVRLVDIAGGDCCACCGTHVKTTGQIGIIKILDHKRYKGGTRLTMAAGNRAFAAFDLRQRQLDHISILLSSKIMQCDVAVERLIDDNAAHKNRISNLETEIVRIKAGYAIRTDHITFYEEKNLEPSIVRLLALELSKQTEGLCAVLSEKDRTTRYALSSADLDVRIICREFNEIFAGRGGGKPGLVEGYISGDTREAKQFLLTYGK